MPAVQFVPQTGTNQDDQDARKTIRRHVMIGKNLKRTPKNPKQPSMKGAGVFRQDALLVRDSQAGASIPPRVGSDLSLLMLADTIEPRLMKETLNFCSTSNKALFILEPCISFDQSAAKPICLDSLACDALYLNVMVFGVQTYLELVCRQTIPAYPPGSRSPTSFHYGKAIGLLRDRLADANSQTSSICGITFHCVMLLAVHSLFTLDTDSARNHLLGLKKLLCISDDGRHSFKMWTKQIIELLRCDISICIARGDVPVFFSSTDPEYQLPELSFRERIPTRCVPTSDSELARIWVVFDQFCTLVNDAATKRERLPEQMLLDTIVPVMYRLLDMSAVLDTVSEAIGLAMLCLGTCTFLNWPQLRIPVKWLQFQYGQSLHRLMQPDSDQCDPELLLWLLAIYGVTFPHLGTGQKHELQMWLLEVAERCGCEDWSETKAALKSFPWVDFVCDHEATKLFHGIFSGGRKDLSVTERESELGLS